MNFKDLGSFAVHLVELEIKQVAALHVGLRLIAQLVEASAKAELGTYQPEVGPFPAWQPLSDFTIEQRVKLGYTPDDPLLRSGALRHAITHDVGLLEAVIGVKIGSGTNPEGVELSEVAVWMEFGTRIAPPRPFLGPAAFHNHERIKRILGGAVLSGLLGGSLIHPALGYDAKI